MKISENQNKYRLNNNKQLSRSKILLEADFLSFFNHNTLSRTQTWQAATAFVSGQSEAARARNWLFNPVLQFFNDKD